MDRDNDQVAMEMLRLFLTVQLLRVDPSVLVARGQKVQTSRTDLQNLENQILALARFQSDIERENLIQWVESSRRPEGSDNFWKLEANIREDLIESARRGKRGPTDQFMTDAGYLAEIWDESIRNQQVRQERVPMDRHPRSARETALVIVRTRAGLQGMYLVGDIDNELRQSLNESLDSFAAQLYATTRRAIQTPFPADSLLSRIGAIRSR